MQDKNYIEQVTNLERAKEKYIPKSIFDDVMGTLIANLDGHDLEEENEISNYVELMEEKANNNARELFVIENKDDKNDISTCPYCGGEMLLEFSKENERSYYNRGYRIRGEQVVYKCAYCGATSPKVTVRIMHLNEDAVREEIERQIEYAKEAIKSEEEGDYDD